MNPQTKIIPSLMRKIFVNDIGTQRRVNMTLFIGNETVKVYEGNKDLKHLLELMQLFHEDDYSKTRSN